MKFSASAGTNKQAAVDLGADESSVDRWRARFIDRRLKGLHDEPRPGRPPSILLDQVEDVIVATLESAPGKDTNVRLAQLRPERACLRSRRRRRSRRSRSPPVDDGFPRRRPPGHP